MNRKRVVGFVKWKFYGFMSTYQRNFMNEKRNNWLAHVADWRSWLKLTRPIIHILHKNTTLRRQERFFTFLKHQASINFNSIYYVCNKPKFLFENEKKKNQNFLRWFIQIHLHHTKFTNNITTDFFWNWRKTFIQISTL